MTDLSRTIEARACGAWPLPADPTCASIARRVFRHVADGLTVDPEVTCDGVAMVSELAANTLHAQREQRAASPELWLYLRGDGPRRELVCKVFDAFPGWLHGNEPGRAPRRAPADATSGRGLEVVHELSQGRWGYHPTRARLAGWQVRGKAVWFAVPAAVTAARGGPDRTSSRHARMSAAAAMAEIGDALAARGFTGQLARADDPASDMAVASVCAGLSVWCWSGAAWLRAPGFSGDQWGYRDLVEVVEQTVEAYESLAPRTEPLTAMAVTPG